MLRKLIKLNVRSENCISSSLLDLCNEPAFSAVAHWPLPLNIGLRKLLGIILEHYCVCPHYRVRAFWAPSLQYSKFVVALKYPDKKENIFIEQRVKYSLSNLRGSNIME